VIGPARYRAGVQAVPFSKTTHVLRDAFS